MKKYMIPINIGYEKENWISENQVYIKEKKEITEDYIRKTIEEHLSKIEKRSWIEVEFSGIDNEKKENLIQVAYEYIQTGKINGIRICTRPNCINRKFLKVLRKYSVKSIELEAGSTNDYILRRLGIDYNFQDIKKASRMIRFYRFKLGFQVFIGLPDCTKIDDVNTVKALAKLKPKSINATPVLVIKNTQLEKEYNEKKYKPLAIVQAVEIFKEIVKELNERKIETIAIGYGILDNDFEQLEIAEKVVDGPFHPSFRQFVESGLWYDAIVSKIKKMNAKVMQVEVTVNPIDVNNVIGYKQENITKLKDTYNVELIITPDDNIKQGKSKIEITQKF